MPKVDDFVIHLKGVEHVCPIYYTKSDKKFRIEKFPAEVLRPLGVSFHKGAIWGDTQDEAEKKAHEYLNKFNKLQVTAERVLVIDWKAFAFIREEGEGAHLKPYIYAKYWKNIQSNSRYGAPDGKVALSFDYRLLVKKTNAFRENPYYNQYEPDPERAKYTQRDESIQSHEIVLPWTLEAEEFCKQFQRMLENSVRKMSDFLYQDPIELEAKILSISGALPFYDRSLDSKEDEPQ